MPLLQPQEVPKKGLDTEVVSPQAHSLELSRPARASVIPGSSWMQILLKVLFLCPYHESSIIAILR